MALCVRLIKKKQIGILWLQSSPTVAVAVKYIYTLSRFIIYITMPLKMSILTDNGMFESHTNTCLIIIQMKPAKNQVVQLEMKKTMSKPKLDSIDFMHK